MEAGKNQFPNFINVFLPITKKMVANQTVLYKMHFLDTHLLTNC